MDYLLHLLQMTFSSDKQQTSRFGSIRVFMTLPYGIGTVLMSFSAQWIGVSWNLVMYCGMAAFYLLVVSVFLPSKREEEEDENDEFQEWPTNTWERLLINPSEPSLSVTFCQWIYPHVPFLFNLLLFGILLFGVVENLLFLFIVHDLEGNDILCGVTVLVTVLFEIPIFIHSGWFLTHLDYHGCLAAAYLCYALRVGAYTLLTPATRWWILVPELLHGFMFALSYTVVVEYGNLHKGKWGVLVMGTITSVFQSLGPGIGSLVGGYAMETYGAKSLYLVCSVIAFLLGISHVAKRLCQSTRVFPESQ
jgi:predicted MFS family arabinose efflux permease